MSKRINITLKNQQLVENKTKMLLAPYVHNKYYNDKNWQHGSYGSMAAMEAWHIWKNGSYDSMAAMTAWQLWQHGDMAAVTAMVAWQLFQ